MNAIANALGQGEADFAGLTSGISNLENALKGKLSKIAESVNKAKAKAETANTTLQSKLTKLNADAQAKAQSLENEISKLKTGSEAEKKKVIDKVNELSKSVGSMSSALSNNTGSEQTISALDQIIDKISAQLNSGTPAAKSDLNPGAKPFTPESSKQGMNPNAPSFTPGVKRGGYRTTKRRSSSRRRKTSKKRKSSTRKRGGFVFRRRSTRRK